MKKIVLLAFFISFPLAAKEIALIPYKVDNPVSGFAQEKGEDYAKLVGIALHVKKGLSVYNPYQLKKDLDGMGVDPARALTLDNVAAFSQTRYTDYVVTGKIYRLEKMFKAESLVYSASSKEIIARSSVKARTLTDLAAADAKELFSFIRDEQKIEARKVFDITVLVDASWNNSADFEEAKRSLSDALRKIYLAYPGSNVWFLPYNNKSRLTLTGPATSVLSADNTLNEIKLAGGNDDDTFGAALASAVENTSWRKEADRRIFIVTNSPYKDKNASSRYARRAANKKIRIDLFILGRVSPEDSIRYSRLSSMSRGESFDVAYRQPVYGTQGEPYFLYYERGRLFESAGESGDWEKGMFTYPEGKRYGYGTGPSFATELFFTRKADLTPYSMADVYRKNGERHIVSTGNLSSNLRFIMNEFSDGIRPASVAPKKKIARVLLSEGKISVWADVTDLKTYDFLVKKKDLGYGLPLGVVIQSKKDEAYGFTFNSDCYVTDLSGEYIPDQVKIHLSDVAASPSKYFESGLLRPSVWFLDLKVEEIRSLEKIDDIRGN